MQTDARKLLKDSPVMWRRINSIGVILDCNSTYAANLGYAKSEILGRPIFEHIPKESWVAMNDSLKVWFDTGQVRDQKITFMRQDRTTFPGLLHATSLYDENQHLMGSNTVIFDLTQLTDMRITELEEYFEESRKRLDSIRDADYDALDRNSRLEHDGLTAMFDMLLETDLHALRDS